MDATILGLSLCLLCRAVMPRLWCQETRLPWSSLRLYVPLCYVLENGITIIHGYPYCICTGGVGTSGAPGTRVVLVCLFSVHWDIATSYSLSWGVSARELCFLTHRIPVVVLFFLYSNCPILSLLEWLVEGRFWLILVFWLFTGTSCGVCFSSPLPFFLLVPLRFLLAIGYYVHSPDCRSLTWSCWYVTSQLSCSGGNFDGPRCNTVTDSFSQLQTWTCSWVDSAFALLQL